MNRTLYYIDRTVYKRSDFLTQFLELTYKQYMIFIFPLLVVQYLDHYFILSDEKCNQYSSFDQYGNCLV